VLAAVLAVGFSAVAFLASGGVDLAPNTWTEIALLALGAAAGVAAVWRSGPGPAWGLTAVLLFCLLAALSLLSIAWSVQPADSWVEANRTIAYAAAFGGAAACARLAPGRWSALLGAVAILATVLSGYALLVKVFPATLDPTGILGRLRAPLQYWNAVGLAAALGLGPCVWAGARREGHPVLRALAVPAIGVLLVALVLSYSRGALLAAVVGLGLWLAVVPLRLRGALVLALGAAGAAAATGWALSTPAITHDLISLRARTTAGHHFGLVLLAMVIVLTAAGFVAARAIDGVVLSAALRRRVGLVLVVLVGCIPFGGIVGLAVSSRGLTGEVSHLWDTLTNTNGGTGDSAGRLVQISNSRARYWSEGMKVGAHAWLGGVGAAGYGTARNRYSRDFRLAQHAHSYVIETFADFGAVGLCLSLALLVAWAIAAARAVAARARTATIGVERLAERTGLLTLLVVVVVFGVHSAIDWTWFIPGVAVPALVCAGWLAGRGPLASPVGRAARPQSADAEEGTPPPEGRWRRTVSAAVHGVARRPGTSAIAVGMATIALVLAWTTWQPLRSADAEQAALTELSRGNTNAALADARTARSRNPVSVGPLWDLSAIYDSIGNRAAAHGELVGAVRLQPSNAATWVQLAQYDLQLGKLQEATAALRAALYLGPHERATLTAVEQANAALARAAAPPPTRRVRGHHARRSR
jgi:hypothetical protein